MKKLYVLLLVVIFVLSMSLIGIGCKEEVAPAEEVAEEVVEETAPAAEEAEEEESAEEVAEEKEPVDLIFWMPVAQDDPHVPLFKELDEHMKEKYNISVKFEGKSMDAWYELLTTAGMSQSGPDLLFNWSGQAACIDAGKSNLYKPLNDILPEGMYDDISGWAGATDIDGTIYAVPYDLSFAGLAYNKDMFDQVGIDYSDFPKLVYWDDLVDICQKLKSAGINPIGLANKEGYYGEWWIANTIPSYFDSNQEMADYFQNESMNSQPFLDEIAKYKTLYDEGYFLKEGLTLDHTNNTQQQFISEKVAMQFTEAMYYKTYVDALGTEKVGVMLWPYFSNEGELAGNMCGIYNHVIGITPWTEHTDECLKVLQELCATEWGADKVNEILGFVPSYKKWEPEEIADPDWAAYNEKVMGLLLEGEAGSYAYDTWTPEFASTIYQFNGMFLSGDMTAEEFATELDAARGLE